MLNVEIWLNNIVYDALIVGNNKKYTIRKYILYKHITLGKQYEYYSHAIRTQKYTIMYVYY